MNNKLLLDNLRSIPDWPIKGVNFRDVTTLFKSPEALKEINDEMYETCLHDLDEYKKSRIAVAEKEGI